MDKALETLVRDQTEHIGFQLSSWNYYNSFVRMLYLFILSASSKLVTTEFAK